MGVSGLWEFVKDTGEYRALAHLAVVEGFEKNKSSKRAYRIGIDVSIWYKHAMYSKEGENPQLRLMFFRLRQLSELPILPLFVFDGRQRPKVKRGSKMGKSGSHALTDHMKKMLDAFGMEWRQAKGEAEAELAYLNRMGHIDAILTDDCDALVFGGLTIINNWSANLSRNRSNPTAQQNSSSSKKKPQVTIYTAEGIQRLGLSRGDLMLYALLAGGDYHNGVDGFGPKLSFALARCGFGRALLTAYEANAPLQTFLTRWRNEINTELATNSRGFLPPRVRVQVPDDFPDLDILRFYADPACSGRREDGEGGPLRGEAMGGGGHMRDKGSLNLGRLAAFCEEYFEWGYTSSVVKRFRDLLWPSAVMHVLRRAALEADEKERAKRLDGGIEDRSIRFPLKPSRAEGVGTPASFVKETLAPPNKKSDDRNDRIASAFVRRGPGASQSQQSRLEDIPDPHPLISRVVGARHDASTGGILEYRIEVSPIQLVAFTQAGLTGSRPEPNPPPNPPKKPPPPRDSILRMWVPGSMLHQVHPGLAEDYAMREEEKRNKTPTARKKRKAPASDEEEDDDDDRPRGSSPVPTRQVRNEVPREPPSRTRTERAAPPTEQYPEPSQNHVALDPWFAPSAGECMGFLFRFPNPDEDSGEDDTGIPLDKDDALLDNGHNDAPRTSYDAICDQILDGRANKSKKKKASEPRGTKGTTEGMDVTADYDDAPSNSFEALCDQILDGRVQKVAKATKPRKLGRGAATANHAATSAPPRVLASDPLLTKLDKMSARRAAKWQKVAAVDAQPLPAVVAAVSAFPMLPELDYPRCKSFTSASRSQAVSQGSRRTYYPEPSSSQDSRLSNPRDDDIIDLT
ncbi:putative xeroderma pigmentosum G N-region [Lyophyllum shimeji]|uniref:Xeroderma pigmentosum G N-region n=1 Tax=Lyophyllum shimeji TaxID=47721 RepID=A0A9P3PKQ8_LYOSH|nr:putative xeroderma pigmentosum G N-region [Lyophyllum shimeji]